MPGLALTVTLVLLGTVAAETTEVAAGAVVDDRDLVLLSVRAEVVKADAAAKHEKDVPDLDGAHLVCHSTSCAEVQAKLTVLAEKAELTKAKLAECGENRRKLEEDLMAAAVSRAQAEQELQACADDRALLTKQLKECGEKRTEAEEGLAKCAKERAALEAELKQCAEVDRPNAEKALDECGKQRGELEKKLAAIAKNIASGGGEGEGEGETTTRRRRRKNAKLLEEAAEHTGESEETEVSAEHARIAAQVAELVRREEELIEELEAFENKLAEGTEAIQEVDNKIDEHSDNFMKIFAEEETALEKLAAVNEKVKQKQEKMISDLGGLNDASAHLHVSKLQETEAQKDVLKDVLDSASTMSQLLQLNSEAHDLKHQEFTIARKESQDNLIALRSMLAKHEAAGEADKCDEARAKIVEEEAKVAKVESSLKACLDAKKVIATKIEKADEAFKKAQAALEECEKKKAALDLALKECQKKKGAALAKLEECVKRKSVLKEKIAACHKARDAARTKLKECLARKDVLKKKIAEAMKKMAGLIEVSALGADHLSALTGLQDVVDDLRKDTATFKAGLADEHEEQAILEGLLDEMQQDTDEEQTDLIEVQAADADEAAKEAGFFELTQLFRTVQSNIQTANAEDAQAAAAVESSIETIKEAGVTVPDLEEPQVEQSLEKYPPPADSVSYD